VAELPPPEEKASPDDFAVAVVLFLAGLLGVVIGVAADHVLELFFGLIMIGLAVRSWPTSRRD
jgi:hypothetical protein